MTRLAEAIATLRGGAVVAVPTDTVYGLAVDARVADACARLFALKGRPETVALPVLVADRSQADELAVVTPRLTVLAGAFWPGPLTVVVSRRPDVELSLGGDEATIGLRCPDDTVVRQLCRAVGPLAVTSANRHGGPPCTTAAEVRALFGETLVVLDGGRREATPSTVIDLTSEVPRLLREGPIDLAALLAALDGAP